jgi:hypothetical protein
MDGQAVLQPGHCFCTGCFVKVKFPLPPRYRVEGSGLMDSKPTTLVRRHFTYLAQGGKRLVQQKNANSTLQCPDKPPGHQSAAVSPPARKLSSSQEL